MVFILGVSMFSQYLFINNYNVQFENTKFDIPEQYLKCKVKFQKSNLFRIFVVIKFEKYRMEFALVKFWIISFKKIEKWDFKVGASLIILASSFILLTQVIYKYYSFQVSIRYFSYKNLRIMKFIFSQLKIQNLYKIISLTTYLNKLMKIQAYLNNETKNILSVSVAIIQFQICALMKSQKGLEKVDKNLEETPKKKNTQGIKLENQTIEKSPRYSQRSLNIKFSPMKDMNQQKFSMEKLCRSFLNEHKDKIPHNFKIVDIRNDFGVKQRRIYDLMNIFEGSGCVKKVSKGNYTWLGLQSSSIGLLDQRKKDSTNLKYISAQLKKFFIESKQPISLQTLAEKISNQQKQKQATLKSIKRRIYQCCKVFSILGYIKKINKKYVWQNGKEQTLATSQTKKKTKRQQSQEKFEKKWFPDVRNLYTENEIQSMFERLKMYLKDNPK